MDITRSKTEEWGLGPSISADDKVITGRKLPNKLQTLRCFMAFYNDEVKNEKRMHPPAMRSAAALTLNVIKEHFENADVPMQSDNNCKRAIINLYKTYTTQIRSIEKARRERSFAIKKVNAFQQDLQKTMLLWPKNAKAIISSFEHPSKVRDRNIQEDLRFFESMLTDRKQVYGGTDKKTYTLQIEEAEAEEKLAEYQRNQIYEKEQVGKSVQLPDDEDNIVPSTSNDELFTPPKRTTPPSKKKKALLTPTCFRHNSL